MNDVIPLRILSFSPFNDAHASMYSLNRSVEVTMQSDPQPNPSNKLFLSDVIAHADGKRTLNSTRAPLILAFELETLTDTLEVPVFDHHDHQPEGHPETHSTPALNTSQTESHLNHSSHTPQVPPAAPRAVAHLRGDINSSQRSSKNDRKQSANNSHSHLIPESLEPLRHHVGHVTMRVRV